MKHTIFLIIVSFFSGFLIGKNQNINQPPTKEALSTIDPVIEQFFSANSNDLFSALDVSIAPEYESTKFDASPMYSIPEPPNNYFPEGNVSGLKPFVRKLDGDQNIFSIRDPMEKQADIDSDGKLERIVFFSTGAGSSIPQLIQIIKDNQVVFESEGSVMGFEEAYEQPGFILTTKIRQNNSGIRVRYIIDDEGVIKPLWQQRFAGIAL